MIETRTFTRAELEEFLKDGGRCRTVGLVSLCYYDASKAIPYRFGNHHMFGVWEYADGITMWEIVKPPKTLSEFPYDLYPKRHNFNL